MAFSGVKSGLVIGCAAIGLMAAQPAFAQVRTFNLPAQDARRAIPEFGRQAGIQISAPTGRLRGVRTQSVRGDLDARQALRLMLDGTGLEIASDTGSMIVLREMRATLGSGEAQAAGAAADNASADGQEIVVTGTNIRGRAPVGSPLAVVSRTEIARSGYGRVQDVLAQQSQNSAETNEASINYSNRNAGIQLRGLGNGTTLTLLNGQRIPQGGGGLVSDISSIPASAVERIEILPDGASALYGSDAIGGVVNFILRRDFEGLETRLRASTAGGEATELQLGALFGHNWSSANLMIGYEYYQRDALSARDRAYTAANGDLRAFGGSNFRGNQANPGTILNPPGGGATAAIPTGQDGSNVTSANLVPGTANLTDYASFFDILPEQEVHNLFVSGHLDVADGWRVSLDGRFADRRFVVRTRSERRTVTVPASNAFNRFGVPIRVAYDFGEDLGAVTGIGHVTTYALHGGVEGELGGGWSVRVHGNWAHENDANNIVNLLNAANLNGALASSNPATALNVFGDGSFTNPATLAQLRTETGNSTSSWNTYSATAIASGPLLSLPAGPAMLALGADYRHEELSSVDAIAGVVIGTASREVEAVFGELTIPILDAGPDGGADRIELSLAGRYEHYSDVGGTFNPKVGAAFRPVRGLQLRGTWGTSLRAPPFGLARPQYNPPFIFTDTVADPRSASGFSDVIIVGGVVPDLREETAEVWSAGIDVTPPGVPGFRLSASYFNVDYRDKVTTPGSYPNYLSQENLFATVIARNPTPAQVAAICADPNFFGDCSNPASLVAILDTRLRNVARVVTDGIDVDLGYQFASGIGDWTLRARGTRTFNYETQVISRSPVIDFVGALERVPRLRLTGEFSWSRGGLTAGGRVNHTSSGDDVSFTPARRIDSWTTLDLNLSYDFTSGVLAGTTLYLNVNNLLDQAPPLINRNYPRLPYDPANASLLGRQASIQLVRRW